MQLGRSPKLAGYMVLWAALLFIILMVGWAYWTLPPSTTSRLSPESVSELDYFEAHGMLCHREASEYVCEKE